MRLSFALAAFFACGLPAVAQDAQTPSYEPDTRRFGGTFIREAAPSPTACATRCGAEKFCTAWTYLRSTSGDADGTCELKSVMGGKTYDPLATSGVSPVFQARDGAAKLDTAPYERGELQGG